VIRARLTRRDKRALTVKVNGALMEIPAGGPSEMELAL
jgi:hypothetical protein